MIYFLVNNDYHLVDVLNHSRDLKDYEKILIQIPHNLKMLKEHPIFDKCLIYESPFKNKKNFFNFFKIKQIEKQIESLEITNKDILFLYTEYEILNQVFIYKFKQKGAKIFIIEDGGFPTYVTYNVDGEKILPLKHLIKLFYLKYILNYKFINFLYYNKIVFPQIEDEFIDGVLLYLDVPIKRNIKKFILRKKDNLVKLDDEKVVFLNEKIYDYYCEKNIYRKILNDILLNLSNNFKKVYFKFHPRETEEDKSWQIDIIQKYKNIKIINDNCPIEDLIEIYNAKYVVSFLSAALLNLTPKGVVPVYIFHLFDEIKNIPVFKNIKYILDKLNYNFLKKYEDFENVSFKKSNIGNEKKSILDLIQVERD
jgi:hypothetical protein